MSENQEINQTASSNQETERGHSNADMQSVQVYRPRKWLAVVVTGGLAVAAASGFGWLIWASGAFENASEGVKFITEGSIAFALLLVAIVQACVYWSQRRIMNAQWDAMERSLKAVERQEEHLSAQVEAARDAANMAKGQLVAMQHQEQAQFAQLEAMKEQAKTMDRSLVLGTRAYLGIHSVHLDIPSKRLFLNLENVGEIPAKDIVVITEIRTEVPETKYQALCRHMNRSRGLDWGKKDDNRRLQIPYLNRLGRTKVFPGSLRIPVMIRFDDSPYFSDEQFALITGGYAKFRINGLITYSDGFHSGKKTEFAFRYFAQNVLWVPEIVDFPEMQIDPEKPDSDYGGNKPS